ncbi:MAG: hypothetical protein IPQ05_18275 [Leptospiraceae bacterium]|nr:hypothetical protein [Leptospiraceae bacterium]
MLSKAYFAYLSNSENMVKDSTVFSDVKTIFDYNERNAFFLLNRMKIEFNSQNGHQEIIFSLDDGDIENLIKSLTLLKERNLLLKKGLTSIKEMPLISFIGENNS